ncbi:hyaluronidase-like [Hylaeus anthracinus]|uniref:hyaluronidase-like n=1 Tax=Hylaeus volcanicus TaxID=313075 RepID=UPI0023B81675|nr:hyaluronidase-like [Hylaeus volcanicus]XP_053996404.1 hyaluronidase-like [Hylaeus anthracinus]
MIPFLLPLLLAPVLLADGFFFGFRPVTPKDEDRRGFDVYWNVPTFMCHKYGMRFEEVSQKYGILQNAMDEFRGGRIAILYDPGMFPALLKDSNGAVVARNGGVPQEGNLTKHLEVFREHLINQIPDQSFRGIGVIDFESWRPIFRQNWASLQPYKDFSMEIVRREHPFWDSRSVEQEAKRSFEKYGKLFMEETLKVAKETRPAASWGYYAYPYCYNLTPNQPSAQCDKTTVLENDKMSWLFGLEDVLLPSVYLRWSLTSSQRVGLVSGRVKEALRIAQQTTPRKKVLPYYWYKYQDQRDAYLNKADLEATLRKISDLGADGLIIWGSSNDINTKEKCQRFSEYLNNDLGPVVDRVRQTALSLTRYDGHAADNRVAVVVDQV